MVGVSRTMQKGMSTTTTMQDHGSTTNETTSLRHDARIHRGFVMMCEMGCYNLSASAAFLTGCTSRQKKNTSCSAHYARSTTTTKGVRIVLVALSALLFQHCFSCMLILDPS